MNSIPAAGPWLPYPKHKPTDGKPCLLRFANRSWYAGCWDAEREAWSMSQTDYRPFHEDLAVTDFAEVFA